jgi:hypothetical protein
MVKPLPYRAPAKRSSRLSWPGLVDGARTPAAGKSALASPFARTGVEKPEAPADADRVSVPGVWSLAELMGKERMSQERKLESKRPLAAASRPRRPAVVGAVASVLAMIFLVGIGAGLIVRAVPEAAAASTQDDMDGRYRADLKGRPAHLPVVGASCSDSRPAPAPAPPAPSPAMPAVVVASSPNGGKAVAVDEATDLGDLETLAVAAPVAAAVATPVAQQRRPAKPFARPATVAPPSRRPTPAPVRAATAPPAADRSADTLFAGRL